MIDESANLHVGWFATTAVHIALDTAKGTSRNQVVDHFTMTVDAIDSEMMQQRYSDDAAV